MAPVQNLLTISVQGSTWSIGTGVELEKSKSNNPLRSRNTHLGHDLEQTIINGMLVVTKNLIIGQVTGQKAFIVQSDQCVHGEVWVDGISTITDQTTDVVNFSSFSGFQDQSNLGTLLLSHKVVVNSTTGNQRADRNPFGTGVLVRKNNNLVVVNNCLSSFLTDSVQGVGVTSQTFRLVEGDVDVGNRPFWINLVDLFQCGNFIVQENWRRHQKSITLRCIHLQKVSLRTNVALKRHDNSLSDRVDRRICDLSKQLSEIVEHQSWLFGKTSKSGVVTHGSKSLFTSSSHWSKQSNNLFLGFNALAFKLGEEFRHGDHVGQNPCFEIESGSNLLLQFLIVHNSSFLGVNQKHSSWLQSALLHNFVGLNWDHTDFGSTDHSVVIGNVISTRSETVSVEVCTTESSVSKGEKSWTIPWLHQASSPFLTFVNDVFVGQRTNVEPVVETNGVGGLLSEDVKLLFESFLEFGLKLFRGVSSFWLVTWAVNFLENHKRLQNERFSGRGSRTQNGGVDRNVSPAKDSKSQARSDVFESAFGFLENGLVFLEEQVSDSILSTRRKFN
ncbi:hypothetical protein OGAPHI_006970 [Ogataea philodendri]|uniref:Uncharacterized protein n=1 Tax=Ogataea philodendri TaxID=1378263 RepID=A0A9P8NVV3_9ASCO|nr:uncharacterized protein OGAPHI_006970 [Ogataea philodendri]KAH3660384.1 hypothetical protein OGAPHI_006970 [Ogataea philodendri]